MLAKLKIQQPERNKMERNCVYKYDYRVESENFFNKNCLFKKKKKIHEGDDHF
jgi:hypothetical protein